MGGIKTIQGSLFINLIVQVPDVPPNVDATATICFAKLAAFGETTSDRPKVQV